MAEASIKFTVETPKEDLFPRHHGAIDTLDHARRKSAINVDDCIVAYLKDLKAAFHTYGTVLGNCIVKELGVKPMRGEWSFAAFDAVKAAFVEVGFVFFRNLRSLSGEWRLNHHYGSAHLVPLSQRKTGRRTKPPGSWASGYAAIFVTATTLAIGAPALSARCLIWILAARPMSMLKFHGLPSSF